MYEKVMNECFYLKEDIDLDEQAFVNISAQFGKLWNEEDHLIAKEPLGGEVVQWTSKNKFIRMSIPWHADNSASKEYKYPLRSFYAVSIPDSEDSKLFFLDTTAAFEMMSKDRQQYLRDCSIIVGDNPTFKQSGKWTFEDPWVEPFTKIHPITGRENINYGCIALASDVFGLSPDEGYSGTESYNKAILHPDGSKWSDKEISKLFEEMINKVGVYEHKWKEKQFLVMNNWVGLHYKQTTKIIDQERLIWRRTIFQQWHI